MTHYCTYCDYYSRNHFTGKQEPGMAVFVGTHRQVVTHAYGHPIGDPCDMAAPLSTRAPYEASA